MITKLKTQLAFKLARQAVQNGWMFFYLKDPTLLAETLRMSKIIDKSGHGAVVFVEDIDQVTRGDRDSAMQDILEDLKPCTNLLKILGCYPNSEHQN